MVSKLREELTCRIIRGRGAEPARCIGTGAGWQHQLRCCCTTKCFVCETTNGTLAVYDLPLPMISTCQRHLAQQRAGRRVQNKRSFTAQTSRYPYSSLYPRTDDG